MLVLQLKTVGSSDSFYPVSCSENPAEGVTVLDFPRSASFSDASIVW